MHFWIDKRSQGCGYRQPFYLTGYGRNQRYIGGLHRKPMVTPIHRFQSLPAINGIRHTRPTPTTRSVHSPPANDSPSNEPTIREDCQSNQEPSSMIANVSSNTTTPIHLGKPMPKLKCFLWILFAFITIGLAFAKYYFHISIGAESYALGSLLLITLIIVGIVFLCRAVVAVAYVQNESTLPHASEQRDPFDTQTQTSPMRPIPVEMPPPPYHIAIMLPQHNDVDAIQVIRDSPPPTYDKAVT